MRTLTVRSLINNCFVSIEDRAEILAAFEDGNFDDKVVDFIILLLRVFKKQDDFKLREIIKNLKDELLKMGIKLNVKGADDEEF